MIVECDNAMAIDLLSYANKVNPITSNILEEIHRARDFGCLQSHFS